MWADPHQVGLTVWDPDGPDLWCTDTMSLLNGPESSDHSITPSNWQAVNTIHKIDSYSATGPVEQLPTTFTDVLH